MEDVRIKPISYASVHKICSGQVVLTLATAIKELVENSIDAGATIVDVKLKEYGSECIEVIDNGKGVKPCDFQNLTLKHHTSKIEDFSDVPFVSTFGFRGEALSSLCALSNLEIITCHEDSSVGTVLYFDNEGKLVKSVPTPRQVGTTVILKNLFITLPVRHKEFLRNIRREYGKMIQLLSAYCLISLRKRITCTNTLKGKKTVVISSNSSESLGESISCMFGSKQMQNLLEIAQVPPSTDVLEEYFLPPSILEKSAIFKLEGYISNSTHGEGRSSTDRQFYFINGRPCDLPKVAKLINEIYHSFNKHQYPFVLLNIVLTEGFADVNVTPDKRQIFISEEKLLLAIIKTSVLKMYEQQPSQVKINSASLPLHSSTSSDFSTHELQNTQEASKVVIQGSLKRLFSKVENEETDAFSSPHKSQRKDGTDDIQMLETERHTSSNFKATLDRAVLSSVDVCTDSLTDASELELGKSSPKKMDTCGNLSSDLSGSELEKISPKKMNLCVTLSPNTFQNKLEKNSPKKKKNSLTNCTSGNVNFTLTLPFREDKIFKKATFEKRDCNKFKEILQLAQRGTHSAFDVSNKMQKQNVKKSNVQENVFSYFSKETPNFKTLHDSSVSSQEVSCSVTEEKSVTHEENYEKDLSEHSVGSVLDEPALRKKEYKTLSFSMELFKKDKKNSENSETSSKECNYRKFRSKITPTDNQNAEEELKKEISKGSFSQMQIIGQFNLGFIITRLNNDLFIIDQHATDEKYNFETLQKETILETQKLLNPQKLNLSAVSETVLMDNLHIFEKNGFHFSINEENSVGNKVQLVSVPVSKNWSFGKEDVDELIFMLSDNPVHMIRPSRVNQMFASRACRKSVMIGTPLTVPIMKKLVAHMGEIEQPWNCPHGRPTIRHLFNLELLKSVSKN